MRALRWPAFLLLAGCVGCAKPAVQPVNPTPTDVVVGLPSTREITDYEEFTGHTDAIKSVQIKARVTGYLDKKDFVDGQDVQEGDVLYEIDDRPYKTALQSAEALVAQGEAHRIRLAADYRRAANLFQKAAIGKQEFDLITSNFAEAQAQLGASKAQLDNARLNMGFTKIRAPMSGQLSRTLVDPGNLVRQNSTILNDIVATNELYAYFDISVDAMERVKTVIEQGQVGGKDNKVVPVEVGTSVDSDRYVDAMEQLRDLGEQRKRVEAQWKKAVQDAEDQAKKIAQAEAQVKDFAVDSAKPADLEAKRKKELAENLASQGKTAGDFEAVRKKSAENLASLDQKVAEAEKAKPPEFPYKGAVNFSENKLDAATGTLRVRGVITNPPPAILAPGMFVRVRLPIGDAHPALLVPEDSIGSDQGRSFIYVINSRDEVEYRPVVTGALFSGPVGTKLRAIREGIASGERFIENSDAIRRVRPGAKVAPSDGETGANPPKVASR